MIKDYDFSCCTLCPRSCRADRTGGGTGYCGMPDRIFAARASLHMWEEPCISGEKGSGTVFFSGCSLGCIYCQNRQISLDHAGKEITEKRLSEIFLELQEKGAANINLVTGVHYVPQIIRALEQAGKEGLVLPVVYNSGGYESVETLRMLEGFIDIYLPDFKYMDRELASALSNAPDYPERAAEAVREMVRQTGRCVFSPDGYLERGTIIRHLVLPGHVRNSRQVLEYLARTFGDTVWLSIMNQYTPVGSYPDHPELNRKVTKREYEKVLDFALNLGIENAFFQEGETALESFIPDFNEGLPH